MIDHVYILMQKAPDINDPGFQERNPHIQLLINYAKNAKWENYSRFKKIMKDGIPGMYSEPKAFVELTVLLRSIKLFHKYNQVYHCLNKTEPKQISYHYKDYTIYKVPLIHGKREGKEETGNESQIKINPT